MGNAIRQLIHNKLIEKEGYSLQPNFSQNFSKTNDSSVENIWTQPSDGTTYKVSDYNPTRTLHAAHASAYGLQGWNGACATTHLRTIIPIIF